MYRISNQEKKTLSEGLKVVRVQTEKTTFGKPNTEKGGQIISTPTKVLLFKFIFY